MLSIINGENVFAKTVSLSETFTVEQIEYKGLAHFSYIVMANKKILLIDPRRDAGIYYKYASNNNAQIVGIIETHPHADFVSSHLEIQKKLRIPVYMSSLTKPGYSGTAFDDGETIMISDSIGLRSMYTPGHAPDHISAVLFENGKDIAVFSGDSLLIGDVGRPDLRDFSIDPDAQRQRLAGMMYDTIHEKFARLSNDVIVYPAHGAGSLCGKTIRKAASSTIGYERENNHAFQKKMKADFVQSLLADQPFVPKYFQYDVELNIKGAPELGKSIASINRLAKNYQPGVNAIVIDARPQDLFKASYLPNAINIQGAGSFETWLGTLVAPASDFYLVAENDESLDMVIAKAAAIGYETKIKGAFVYDAGNGKHIPVLEKSTLSNGQTNYTYVDVRTTKEVQQQAVFPNSINIPLQELSERISEIPTDKPIVVNCASGYRSATATSIIKKNLPEAKVFDLGKAVTEYLKEDRKD
jgi:hydroxyacylglutathione hydrolase